MKYKQLTSEQRYAIFIGLQEGKSKRSIASVYRSKFTNGLVEK